MISAMRYNPRYIFLGEIRSPKTAKEAIRAAVNGHRVVSTIHGSSVQGSLYALQQIASAEGEMDPYVALLLMVYCVLYIRSCTLSIMVRENLHAIFCAMMGHHQYLLRLEVVSSNC